MTKKDTIINKLNNVITYYCTNNRTKKFSTNGKRHSICNCYLKYNRNKNIYVMYNNHSEKYISLNKIIYDNSKDINIEVENSK